MVPAVPRRRALAQIPTDEEAYGDRHVRHNDRRYALWDRPRRRPDGIHIFRGIPYAAPPFGANHLRAPQPAEPWTGVRDALVDGAKPPQPPFPGTENAPAPWDRAPVGEDCLNLNIWTPDPGKVGLPVMVWITGGSFRAGSNAWYDGSRFARDGVVCVAINYRSGPEGFLYLRDGTANRGLLDQVAALRWVRENSRRSVATRTTSPSAASPRAR